MSRFTPDDAIVSPGIETLDFRLRMLTINDLVKDYDAVMTSVERLTGVFGLNDTWPEGLTLEADLVDLGWHQKEFELRSSFAYTVMSLDENRCLGCVYVEPSEKLAYEARVILWVRSSEAGTGLDDKLYSTVKQWLAEKWWFTEVGFPGRELTWQQWESLAEK